MNFVAKNGKGIVREKLGWTIVNYITLARALWSSPRPERNGMDMNRGVEFWGVVGRQVIGDRLEFHEAISRKMINPAIITAAINLPQGVKTIFSVIQLTMLIKTTTTTKPNTPNIINTNRPAKQSHMKPKSPTSHPRNSIPKAAITIRMTTMVAITPRTISPYDRRRSILTTPF